MLQCEECEHFRRDAQGRIQLSCDPFSTIREPECLLKWQLLRQDALLQAYHSMLGWYQKLAPMQEQMFQYMKREMDEMDEGESWKYSDQDDDEGEDDEAFEDERPY